MAGAGHDGKRKEIEEKAARLLAMDHFAVLGVSRTASVEEVGRAFTNAAKEWHPDRIPPGLEDMSPLFTHVFARLDEARHALSDPSRRLQYATNLQKGVHPAVAAASAQSHGAEAQLEAKKAEALLKKNDLAGAEQHLRRAVQLAPGNATYQADLIGLLARRPGIAHAKLKELGQELSRLLQQDEKCERAYFERARIRKRLEDPNGAAADFARAAELNPRNVEAAREVRIHTMRTEKKEEPATGGLRGFLEKLVKR